MTIKKITLASAALAVLSAPAFANNLPTDFATLDKDGNGTVSFAEYQAHSQTLGLSMTQAAQDFTRAAQGDALLTEEELNSALAFADQPYALQDLNTHIEVASEPAPLPVAETIEEAPVKAFEPIISETPPVETNAETETIIVEPVMTAPEVLEPAPTELETIEPSITEAPLEDVMGEVENYLPDTSSEDPLETPSEEGSKDIIEEDPS